MAEFTNGPRLAHVPCMFYRGTWHGFLAPWTAERTGGGFRVVDASRRTLAYIHTRADKTGADIAKVLLDDGKLLAERLAMLPVWRSAVTD